MNKSKAADEVLRSLFIVNSWLELLMEVAEEVDDIDIAHADRLEALEDSLERLIGAAQECPSAIRRGPVLGLRYVVERLASDMSDPDLLVEHDDLPEDDTFINREEAAGTASAVLSGLAEALQDVEDCLVGAARQLTVAQNIPDEMVKIGHDAAREWSRGAITAIASMEQSIAAAPQKDAMANMAIVRDCWVTICATACALGQIADGEALDARAFLGQLMEADQSASRASTSLVWRRSLEPWTTADPFGDSVLPALSSLKSLVDQATNLVVEGLASRSENLHRIVWRDLSKGRVDIDESEARRIARESAPKVVLPQAQSPEQVVAGLVAAAKSLSREWGVA